MKLVLASHGTRGDIEPCAALGLELVRRGHDVRMAVPTNMLDFVESAGLAAVAYGPDWQAPPDEDFARKFSQTHDPISVLVQYATQVWLEMGMKLAALAKGADLLLAGMFEQGLATNVAEYYGIPLAALHCYPMQEFVPMLPPQLGWLQSRITNEAEDAQRRALGLPEARMAGPGSLEIQAYDELCFPGLAAEWAKADGRRPFVGALAMEVPTDADDEVASWMAAGTPPIYFGFGSMPVASPAETLAMISTACLQLGERALICTGANDFTQAPHFDHVKVVGAVNHAAIFPSCRAVVHHGGAGTTARGMRSGIPTLILWMGADQSIWADVVKQLNVGSAQPFAAATTESLIADLRCILAPQYRTRAREIATRMTKPAESAARAADLLEDTARLSPV
ncbi:glycosyltransferase [Mycobacterium fragae]|uniref:Glycosyltransferase n=1 Tax=Mycobacterium fragae TaxID=1260918 RepID=A0A1X1UUV2_9MYCO|nr:glycosyltransferase [Mycobacterium fragae]MCV7398729.1 glycosyltransferase [Mycobacterium fragae]ORV60529.1 glycosyltransferase [Mycobacterium fragae]